MIPGIILFAFRPSVLSSVIGHSHHEQNLAMYGLHALRFGESDSGDHPFFFFVLLHLVHHSLVIPTTGKTLAMYGLPLCGSGD